MNVTTTNSILLPSSGNRPAISLHNKGATGVKIDFNRAAIFSNDSGYLLRPDKQVSFSGSLASAEIHAISAPNSTTSNQMIIILGRVTSAGLAIVQNESERDLLFPNPPIGFSVYNQARKLQEYSDGTHWLNAHMIKLVNKSGAQLERGMLVKISSLHDHSCRLLERRDKGNRVIGVVVDGAPDNEPVTIAISGTCEVLVDGSVSVGHYLTKSLTSGHAKDSGASPSVHDFGVALAGRDDTGLIKSLISLITEVR